jgi:hypothetical protein
LTLLNIDEKQWKSTQKSGKMSHVQELEESISLKCAYYSK